MKIIILIIISLVITLIPTNFNTKEENICEVENNIESIEIICNEQDETIEEHKNINVISESEENNIVVEKKNDIIIKENKKETKQQKESKQENSSSVKEETIHYEEIKQEEPAEKVDDIVPQEEEKPEVIINEVPKKNGYYYNEQESNRLVSEFKRITNYNSNFTVRIDKKAKNSNPFYPYREDQIEMQVNGATFGYYIVYAEDYYKDDIKQRTLYYITFDS